MPFAHITAVAEADIPYKACAAWTYNKQDELQIYVGFSSTRELIEWMNSTVDDTDGDGICISGEWEIDDTGDMYDFDGWQWRRVCSTGSTPTTTGWVADRKVSGVRLHPDPTLLAGAR